MIHKNERIRRLMKNWRQEIGKSTGKKCLEISKLPRLNYKEKEFLKKRITSKEIISVIKNLSTVKTWDQMSSLEKIHQPFKEALMQVILKLLPRKKKCF